MEKDIIRTVNYFRLYLYPPLFEEIHAFLPKDISIPSLKKTLNMLVFQKKLIKYSGRYTLPEYGIKGAKIINKNDAMEQWNKLNKRQLISHKKLQRISFRLYLKLISFFPQIKLVGLSGTLAMMNANKEDDIDLFILTAKKRLWTGRVIAFILAELLGLRRRRGQEKAPNKVCLNLFFDESNLKIPKGKQTEYIAHEVLQLKPLIIKDDIYQRFLGANSWVFKIYPNSESRIQSSELGMLNPKSIHNSKFIILNSLAEWIEAIFKKIQLFFIRRHQTREIITSTQLWFFPEDFEKKLEKLKTRAWSPLG